MMKNSTKNKKEKMGKKTFELKDMQKKLCIIVGTRPNFIKCGPVSRELGKKFDEVLIHTGQHYDYEMNKIFFDELDIPEPDFHLEIGSGTHGEQTGKMLKLIERVLITEKPKLVIVFGDCNNTIAGALASVKLHIPVAHVEAGLRSFDRSMPEEINRVLTDHISKLLFCPTQTSINNLKNEGIVDGVYFTYDVTVDALEYNKKIAEKSDITNHLNLNKKEYLVATVHRAGNTDNKNNLNNIVKAFCEIDEPIVFPIHPRTEKCLKSYGLYNKLNNSSVKLIAPLGYLDFLCLCNNARMILTDSGGIQKEAYILKVPCITLRKNTEWIETINDGWNILAGSNKQKIINLVNNFKPSSNQRFVFGQGNSSKIIANIISDNL